MAIQLLTEDISANEGNIITEAKMQGNDIWLNGTFMQSGTKNRNGRNYQLSEMAEAVANAQRQINEFGGIFGELDHPNGLNINLDRVSHVIKELKMDGNNAVGKIFLLETPMGKLAKELARSGVRFGVSSRGTGSVNESDGTVTSFNLTTIDLVATPSCASATPTPVYEALMNTIQGKKVMTLSESLQHDKDAQKYFTKEINKFLSKLF